MSAGRPILVTGSHRSGSTWTGHMLALCPQLVYIQEPFNSDYFDPGICGARFRYRFTYVTGENEDPWLKPLARTTALRYNGFEAFRAAPGDWRQTLAAARRFRAARAAGGRALLKDPLALLAAGWLADRFDAAVVVLIRHPAAFVASVKRFGWQSPVRELLDQPLLVRDYLTPLRREAEKYAAPTADPVAQAAMLWTMLYHVVRSYQRQHPEWIFIRHEDLSAAPVPQFETLYRQLELPFDDAVAQTIEAFTSAGNPAATPPNSTVVRVDSRANIHAWKDRLTAEEVKRVRALTEPVARHFYSSDEW